MFASPYDCCGCSACASCCPAGAVRMCADQEGFLYPQVDPEKCIDCGLCEQVCPLKDAGRNVGRREPIRIFAVKNRDAAARMQSASGGAFPLFAAWMEKEGGVIYGAAYDQDFRVCHQRAEGPGEWKKFCTSKYVQSAMEDCFAQVKMDLEAGRPVLFSGTPCQVQGLKNYLKDVDTGKLLTCDLICRAVPSPLVWETWLGSIREQISGPVSKINFREKARTGWHNNSLTLTGKDGQVLYSETHGQNAFSKVFFQGLITRPACYHCAFASFERPGDITLGDYWGVEKNTPEFDDDQGISLVMCNTEKGLDVWDQVSAGAESFCVSKEQCRQPALEKPQEEPEGRKAFWEAYQKQGLNQYM